MKRFPIILMSGMLMMASTLHAQLPDPVAMGGAANAIEAKIDFALKSDPGGTIRIHWLPNIYFVDMAGSMVAGMFPEGSFYNGMPVLRKMNASTFLQKHLAPYLRLKSSVTIPT